MRAYDIIKKKRDGCVLRHDEMKSFFNACLNEKIPDYQVSAFLMAAFLQGLNADETRFLTEIMLNSGDVIDLEGIKGPKVDKHSTGGVGDKVSLILTPMLASAGVVVPMMSGRGLGHTGGTLDKLESIPGFRTFLGIEEFKAALLKTGCAMIGFSAEMAPLDKKLYALRDVTATVESIPLITASIMSKKLSEGIEGLVLDVKVGSGAFMKDLGSARELASRMVETGKSFGVRTIAVITDMNEPLGLAIGNSLEVIESIDALRGEGPEDLMEVTLFLGAVMLQIAGVENDMDEGRRRLEQLVTDGSALKRFKEMVLQQGGDIDVINRPSRLLPARLPVDVPSEQEGYIQSMDAGAVGTASMLLGSGRETMDDSIDHSAGILLKSKVGDYVKKGDILCTLRSRDDVMIKSAGAMFLNALSFGADPPDKRHMIIEVIR
jgi:pyrimidine-nucleoside phosphorylase